MKNKIILLMIVGQMAMGAGVMAQNVAINSTGATPDGSAILDISSGTKGLLIPRMTTNPTTTPANGLLIYNTTTNSLNANIGSTTTPNWSNLWGSAGNILFSSGNQFLGTTNTTTNSVAPISLRIRTNNVERMVVDSASGFVGIGLTSTAAVPIPTSTLQVNGSFATAVATYSTAQTLTSTNNLVLVSAAITITLPSASTCSGRMITIKNIATISSTSPIIVTIKPSAATETIDGATTLTLSNTASFKFVSIQCDGSVWYIIANN